MKQVLPPIDVTKASANASMAEIDDNQGAKVITSG